MKSLVVFTITLVIFCLMLGIVASFSDQIGVNVSKDSIGILADVEYAQDFWESEVDVQVQRSDITTLVANAGLTFNYKQVGLNPFMSYNKDKVGAIADIGLLGNFSWRGLDIGVGTSLRGANPTTDSGQDGWIDGNPVSGFTTIAPNAYSLPEVDNVNFVLKTAFEKWDIETALTVYEPLTQRELVPTIVISRSQTSIHLFQNVLASLIVDARTYVHTDGAEIAITPIGNIVYKFR